MTKLINFSTLKKAWRRPRLNFINVLCPAFTCVDPKSVKRYWQLDWVLTLCGATGVKAVCKYVDEINPKKLHEDFGGSPKCLY
jgi:hypothetical protein